MKNRQGVLKIHRWMGLALAVLFFIQGLTGVFMVFRDEIEPVVHPALRVGQEGPRLPIQQLFETVQAAHPGALVTRAEMPTSAGQAILFKLKDPVDGSLILTAIDPYHNRIVKDGGVSSWPVEWIFQVHEQLLAGSVGDFIVGLEGIALIAVSVTGLWFWWPGRARFSKGFRVVWNANQDIRWRTLHRAAGAAAAPVLIVIALTGALMVWKEPVRALLGAQGKPAPTVARQPGRGMVPLDGLVAKAQAEAGGGALRQIRFSSGGRVIAVYLESSRTIRADGTAQYYYDGYDGTRMATYIAGEQSASSEFLDWLYPVHTGIWGGLFGRLLLLAAGVTLVGLGLSGPWLWYSHRSRRKKSPRRQAI